MDNYQSLNDILRSRLDNKKGIHHINSEQEEIFLTYCEFYQKASSILAQLQSWGMKPGDELVIALENNELFLEVFWACLLGKICTDKIYEIVRNIHLLF